MAAHPGVEVVEYPGLPQHPDHELAGRLFKRGRYGGVVAIVLPGGREAAACFCDRLRIAKVASSLGGIHTVVSPIATTTHRQLDDRALGAAGFDPGAVRISVGLEDVEDVIADALQSLESMRR
jgi:cystathionine beta-lyase/cystathionine gamma-synthase